MRVRFGSREGDRWLAENATLRILLRNAYDAQLSRASGRPVLDRTGFKDRLP